MEVTETQGLEVTVDLVEELGAAAYVHGRAVLASGEKTVVARVAGRSTIRRGDTVRVAPDAARLHLFDTDSGSRLAEDARRAA
ncbi:TOBE domain-containing protein [Brevibacterium linens]|uniref:TOBE domain-containing protein n=1 Tax=Brevibacterium linens TaxID=1703 RepID=UPI003F8BD067